MRTLTKANLGFCIALLAATGIVYLGRVPIPFYYPLSFLALLVVLTVSIVTLALSLMRHDHIAAVLAGVALVVALVAVPLSYLLFRVGMGT